MNYYLKIIFYLFLFSSFILSCKKDKNNVSNEIISQRKFISMLVDIHKADAYLLMNGYTDDKFVNRLDSLSYYNSIFVKYGVNRQEFINTLNYYINNMEKLLEIQKIVKTKLDEEFALLDTISRKSQYQVDLWTQKRKWNIKQEGSDNIIPFSLETHEQGTYSIEAQYYIYKDNTSENFEMKIISYYSDSSSDTSNFDFNPFKVSRNTWLKYTLSHTTKSEKQLVRIEGYVLGITWKKAFTHIDIKEVKLIFDRAE